jgi:hypothetical protein
MLMTKLKLAASGVLLVMVVTIFLLQHQAQTKLREENALLREQIKRFEEAGNENQRGSNPLKEAANSAQLPKEEFQELLRLRGEVGALRSQRKEMQMVQAENRRLLLAQSPRSAVAAQPAAAPDSFPRETWAFAGYADPESALQSLTWAMSKGDLKTMVASVSPEEEAKVRREFDGKSESEIAAGAAAEITGFRILKKQAISDDEVVLTVFADGKEDTVKLKFKRFGTEWKMSGEEHGH